MARKQKLITKAIEKLIAKYPIGSQDGKGLDAKVICKFFLPCSGATWYILEGEKQENGDYLLYGLATLFGDSYEYGYVMYSELAAIKKRFLFDYVYIERDISIENDTLLSVVSFDSVLKDSLSFLFK